MVVATSKANTSHFSINPTKTRTSKTRTLDHLHQCLTTSLGALASSEEDEEDEEDDQDQDE